MVTKADISLSKEEFEKNKIMIRAYRFHQQYKSLQHGMKRLGEGCGSTSLIYTVPLSWRLNINKTGFIELRGLNWLYLAK